MKKLVALSIALLFTGYHLKAQEQKTEQKEKPNIVFILADDLGWADLPVYGNKFNEAPNLDRLASEGIRFTNAYAACPVCSPSRASIQTGQYPARVGVIDWIPGHWRPYEKVIVPKNRTQYLPSEVITIGEAMKSAGYTTGYFGKWHLGDIKPEYHPLNQGYDQANTGMGYYNVKFKPARPHDALERHSELLADFGEEFIEKNKDKPFFLFLAYWDVHVQLDADRDLIDKYLQKPKVDGYPCNAVYAAMIEHLDRSVGSILGKLEDLGLSKNTVVVFFSDNGGLNKRFDTIPLIAEDKQPIYKNDSLLYIASSNKPLRGEKGTLYEGGIREPMIVKWPGKVKGGSVSDAILSSVDFFPTLVELAGGKMPGPQRQICDGESFVPELEGKPQEKDRTVYWHYPVYHHGVPASAIRRGDWKLIQDLVNKKYELYNLKVDIGESHDLSTTDPGKVKELAHLLDQWRAEVGARIPVPNPDFDKKRRYEWGEYPDRK